MEILENHEKSNPKLDQTFRDKVEAAIKVKGNPAALDAKSKGLIDEALASEPARATLGPDRVELACGHSCASDG